jgi:hypothetical protein
MPSDEKLFGRVQCFQIVCDSHDLVMNVGHALGSFALSASDGLRVAIDPVHGPRAEHLRYEDTHNSVAATEVEHLVLRLEIHTRQQEVGTGIHKCGKKRVGAVSKISGVPLILAWIVIR